MNSVPIDINEIKSLADFEVIEIVDDSNPFPTLLGIKWALENQVVINLKKIIMISEGDDLQVIVPLDPVKGSQYIGLVQDEQAELDNIYHLTAQKANYNDLIADKTLRF